MSCEVIVGPKTCSRRGPLNKGDREKQKEQKNSELILEGRQCHRCFLVLDKFVLVLGGHRSILYILSYFSTQKQLNGFYQKIFRRKSFT